MTGEPDIQPEEWYPDIQRIINGIKIGAYDGAFIEIEEALSQRREVRKAQILELVREVFGEDADVVSRSEAPRVEPNAPLENLFIKKSKAETDTSDDALSQSTSDPFEHMDKTEVAMEGDESSQARAAPDIERRGAVISGLHSSDIRD